MREPPERQSTAHNANSPNYRRMKTVIGALIAIALTVSGPVAETIRDAPVCGTCHANGAVDVSLPIYAGPLAPGAEYVSTGASPLAAGGVVVAAVSDDVYVAELPSSLDDVVRFITAHEDRIDPEMDIALRDAMGVARDVFRDGDYMIVVIPALRTTGSSPSITSFPMVWSCTCFPTPRRNSTSWPGERR